MKETLNNAEWREETGGLKHTQWFAPSVGQWILALKGMDAWNKDPTWFIRNYYDYCHNGGYRFMNKRSWSMDFIKDIFKNGVWTSTEADEDHAFLFRIEMNEYNEYKYIFEAKSKNEEHWAFPFIGIGDNGEFYNEVDFY